MDVQASDFARLPDRSYRCKFPYRAVEAFTSEQCVVTLPRIGYGYPPAYRQLAEQELSPRKIHSLVGCSPSPQDLPGDDRQLLESWPNRETVENIGERIRQLRESRGMTQNQLQERSRVSRSYLSRIESGQPRHAREDR